MSIATTSNPFTSLPRDTRLEIFKYLSLPEILAVAPTCKIFDVTSRANELWQRFQNIYLPRLLFDPTQTYKPQFLKAFSLLQENIRKRTGLSSYIFNSAGQAVRSNGPKITQLIADKNFIFAHNGYTIKVLAQVDPRYFFGVRQELTISRGNNITCAGVNDQFFVVGTSQGSIIHWSKTPEGVKEEAQTILESSKFAPSSLCCSNNNLSVGFTDGSVKIWKLWQKGALEKEPISVKCHEADVEGIDFNGFKLITASRNEIKIWNENKEWVLKQTIDTKCSSILSQMIVTGNRITVLYQKGVIAAWTSDIQGNYQMQLSQDNFPYSSIICAGPLNFMFINNFIYQVVPTCKKDGDIFENEHLKTLVEISEPSINSALAYHQGQLVMGQKDGTIAIQSFHPTADQMAAGKGYSITGLFQSVASYFWKSN